MSFFFDSMYYLVKRLIDIIGACLIGTFFLPLAVVTALAIIFDSPGPVLADTPMRIGKNGKLFKLFKFRSMVVNAHKVLRTDPKMRKLYEQYKKK